MIYQTDEQQSCESAQLLDSTFVSRGTCYYIVRKRWGVLFLVSVLLFLDMFSYTFFSFINDLTSFYFRVDPALVDLQATMNLVGRTFSLIVVSIFGELMTFRNLAVLGAAVNTLATFLISIGVALKMFGFVIAGMFLSGNSTSIFMSLIQLCAGNWFPQNERGRANAFPWVSRRLSHLSTNIIATRAMGVSYNEEQLHQIMESLNETNTFDKQFQVAYASVFGSISSLSLLCTALSLIYLSDRPPEAGVIEQFDDERSSSNKVDPISAESRSSFKLKRELGEIKYLLTYPPFLIITCVYTFAMVERPLGTVLISSFMLNEFPTLNDQFVGIMVSIGIVLATICSGIAGIILDKFAMPRLTFLCFATVAAISLAIFSLCFQIHSVVGVCVAFLTLWSARDGVLVCCTHRLTGITANLPSSTRVKAYAIPLAALALASTFSIFVMRILMRMFSSAVAALFPLPFLIVAMLLYVFLWPFLRDPK